jgi:hypothetical protein
MCRRDPRKIDDLRSLGRDRNRCRGHRAPVLSGRSSLPIEAAVLREKVKPGTGQPRGEQTTSTERKNR